MNETSSACTVRNLITIFMFVGSCRTSRKEMEITSRKTKPGGDGKAAVFCNDNSNCECLAVFVACVFCDDEWILSIACSFSYLL
jgi:hypothetical protein